MSKEILINQLYAGDYLKEGENIGHEVINLFKDDAGNNNLFITPSGYVKNHDLEAVIFVRNVSERRTVEIIGVAKELYPPTDCEISESKYAGVTLEEIFKSNTYRGDEDVFNHHITYRANCFLRPSKRIFITLDKDVDNSNEYTWQLDSEKKVITNQSLRSYYSVEDDAVAYNQLRELLNNSDLWEDNNTTEKLLPDGRVQFESPSFLEVIRKEDDENIFSNLLAYFFEYSHRSFQKFASDATLLDIDDMRTSFVIYREVKERIDLWIESDKDVIVIENKIKSGINGVTQDDYSQLDKYREYTEEYVKGNGKKPHYYIFAPDYARFDLAKYDPAGNYKLIKYSDIYNFFVKETETYIADRSFPDFIRGLKRHTKTYSELQFDTMRSRLLRKISMLQ